ncbi:MAG TPA: IS30 family transposase [Campylobacterales bacterium]|nr:IS30 family transposase [Campylobacterales bacterium]
MSYKHLTLEQRYHIQAYKSRGYTNKEIAKQLGVHPSTISREIHRNKGEIFSIYFAGGAEKKAKKRQAYKSRKANLKLIETNIKLINKYLLKQYSPEQISATLEMKHQKKISHVTIYKYIYSNRLAEGDLYKQLRHKGKKRIKYGSKRKSRIKDRVSIHKRPAIVEDKTRLGDFEIDTIIGAGKKGAIVTMVDRVSMFLKLSVPCSKNAKIVANEIKRLLYPFKKKIHTITTDNGLEFAQHKTISKSLRCDYYFCDPYSSWQRGLNENINGLIRQYIPKGSSFENITKKQIRQIENKLNHRPRKSLGWKTPYEVFHQKEVA